MSFDIIVGHDSFVFRPNLGSTYVRKIESRRIVVHTTELICHLLTMASAESGQTQPSGGVSHSSKLHIISYTLLWI